MSFVQWFDHLTMNGILLAAPRSNRSPASGSSKVQRSKFKEDAVCRVRVSKQSRDFCNQPIERFERARSCDDTFLAARDATPPSVLLFSPLVVTRLRVLQ
jgi:hypothetical protein